jgi:hypothetical protein
MLDFVKFSAPQRVLGYGLALLGKSLQCLAKSNGILNPAPVAAYQQTQVAAIR